MQHSTTSKPARRILAALAVGSLLLTAACSEDEATGPQNTPQDLSGLQVDPAASAKLPDRVKQSKKITVVMNVSSAPTKFRAEDNKTIVGLNPDMANALGKVLGVEVVVEDVQFDGIIPGLQSKRYDMAVSSMAPSAERVKVLDMVRYGAWGTSLAVKDKNPKNISVDDLCGRTVGVQQGSIQHTTRLPALSETCTKAGKPAVNMIVLPDQTTALLQLSTDRLEAVLADTPVLAWAGKQRPGTIALVGEMNKGNIDVALPKDSDLTPAVQAAMQNLLTTPAYKEIYAKWGMDSAVVTEAVLETGAE